MKDKKKIIGTYLLIAIISGFAGFLYEYIFYFLNSGLKTFYWRGANFIPWIDIYTIGAIAIYKLCLKHKKRPLKVFVLSGLTCGLIEYLAGILIFIIRDGHRAWNYNTEILSWGSINGFVCLRSVLVFATFGLILIYLALPIIEKIVDSKNYNKIYPIIVLIICILLFDEVYNMVLVRLFNLPSAYSIYSNHGINYLNSNV